MEINKLNQRPGIAGNAKLEKAYFLFDRLLDELRKKELPDSIMAYINKDIEELNSVSGVRVDLRKVIRKKQAGIIKVLEKDLKVVPKNYYRNQWLAIGMSAFGIPLGVAFGASQGNMAFIGVGIPIGMAIGSAIGAGMDKKAFNEGRQLDIVIES